MNNVICAIAKNENIYINDWCRYHLNLGFDSIYLFDNNDSNSEFVGDYIDDDIISRVHIFNVNDIHKTDFQNECYTKFYKKYKNTFDWCAFIDIDEFIELKEFDNIKDFLSQDIFKDFESIKLQWHAYGDDETITRDLSVPVNVYFKNWLKEDKKLNRWCKSIVKGKIPTLYFDSSHVASKTVGSLQQCLTDGTPTKFGKYIDVDARVPEAKAWVNHYITKSLDEFLNQKLGRTDIQFEDRRLGLDYYWRVNKKTAEKEKYIDQFMKGHIEKSVPREVEYRIKHVITSVLGCEPMDVSPLKYLSGGYTNSSYVFSARGVRYVFRDPGRETEKIIDRTHEYEALQLAKKLGIDKTFVTMSQTHGWKFSTFLSNCYSPDYNNFEDSKLVINKIRELHNKQAHVKWSFNPWTDAFKLEGLLKKKELFDVDLKEKIAKIYKEVEKDTWAKKCFCHCDVYNKNFLINRKTKEVTLLDWEYAGEADPAVDVAYYIVDAVYDFDDALKFIKEYLQTDDLRLVKHYLAYIPLIAYYWYVWALFREECGSVIGDIKTNWYNIAIKYSDYFLETYYEK